MDAETTSKLTAAEQAKADAYIKKYGKDAMSQHLMDLGRDDDAGNDLVQKYMKYYVSQGIGTDDNVDDDTDISLCDFIEIETAKSLIAKGVDVNMKDDCGQTPLIYVAKINSNIEVIEFLVSQGADINAKDKNGYTPLHWAVQGGDEALSDSEAKPFDKLFHRAERNDMNDDNFRAGNIEVVRLLLSQEADVHAKIFDGRTPLHFAAAEGDMDVIKLLVFKGADLNAKDNDGYTPLHWAAGRGNTDVVKLLVSQGADPKIKNNRDRMPLDLAEAERRNAIVEYLSGLK